VGGRVEALGGFMDVADRGDTGTDVEELIEALRHEEVDGALEKGAIGAGDQGRVGLEGDDLLGGTAINGQVVIAAEVVIVHAGRAGLV
jgi:hypothetical protein